MSVVCSGAVGVLKSPAFCFLVLIIFLKAFFIMPSRAIPRNEPISQSLIWSAASSALGKLSGSVVYKQPAARLPATDCLSAQAVT